MNFILSLSLKVKIIIAACAVAAAAAVVTVIILNSEEAYRVIKVFELNGSAVVTRENTGDIDAYAGMNLESGDVLSVEENSTLRISLDSDKYILLDGGTVLELIAQGTAADSRTVIELQKGTILNEIKNSLSANSSYEVNTPKATMAVRGTIFTVTTIENPDGSYTTTLYTSEGTVSVQLLDENGDPKGEEVYVPAGGAVTIRTDVNGETGNPADVDGDSYFVFPNDDGSFTVCGNIDPVYYPNGNASAEAQTETDVTSVSSDTETSETSSTAGSTVPKTESTVTSVPFYEAVLPVSDIPTVTTVPPETDEPKPVIPSEMTSFAETSAVTTTAVSEATSEKTKKTERTTAASSEKTTTAVTSATSAAAEARPFYTVTTPPVYTYPQIITPAPTETVPHEPTETVPSETVLTETEPTETVPTETEPIETEPTETEPTETESTETVPTETEPTVTVPTETEPIETEPTETTPAEPTVYKVSFTDENGNVISEAEFDENDTLGTLPPIADKKGYTGKWVSGGTEVTESTVISGDMDIEAVYTPMPVTVIIEGPYGTPDGSGTETILTFTVLYDGKLTDNENGYDLETLSQIAYDHYSDRTSSNYEVKSINVLYENYSQASDDTVITGDSVIIDDGALYCYIVVNFEVEPWWT